MEDLLSELLAPLRLQGVFFSRWAMRAPWGVDGDEEDCALLHYVVAGEFVIELPGAEPVTVRAGDLVVFPHGTAHRLADKPGRATVPLASLLPERNSGGAQLVEIDGPGPAMVMLCGGLHYAAAAAAPLYRALPLMLVLDSDAVRSQPLLAGTLTSLASEWATGEAGAQLVALRGFELTFVLALRAAINLRTAGQTVLRALGHPAISKALLAVHTRFDEPWTLESLAAEAGLSRSAFAATFRELVGQTPIRHLTARRMQEAAQLLTGTALPHSRIAERVGYRSDVGFHLAFRGWAGRTPGEYRRTSATGPASAKLRS